MYASLVRVRNGLLCCQVNCGCVGSIGDMRWFAVRG